MDSDDEVNNQIYEEEKTMKKLLSLMLVLAIVLALPLVGLADTVEVTEPITITLVHSRSSGVHLDEMNRVVEEFNKTNDKGITVIAEYGGGNTEIYSRVAIDSQTGENCQIALLGFTTVGTLAAANMLADMKPYAERDGFDLANLLECFNRGLFYGDALVALPYIRSDSIVYYNKDVWAKAGYDTIPGDIETFTEACKKIYAEQGIPGWRAGVATDFVIGAFVKSIDGAGLVSPDGMSPISLDDGALQEVLTWWNTGAQEGWIEKFTVTDDGTNRLNNFYNGKLACITDSCGSMSTILKNAEEKGLDVGFAPIPGFRGKACSSTGGSNMVIVSKNNTDQQIAASWEFLKFLLSDSQQIINSQATGYVPVTYSAGASKEMADFWAENPSYKYAYDVLEFAIEGYASPFLAAWQGEVTKVWNYVILDQSMTVEEGIAYLNAQKDVVFDPDIL